MGQETSLTALLRDIERHAMALKTLLEQKQYESLALTARDLLSAASRVHARAATMAQLQAEGLV